MRQVTDDFLKEIAKEAIVLYQIDNYKSVLFAECKTWYGTGRRSGLFPVTHEFVSENLQGEVDVAVQTSACAF